MIRTLITIPLLLIVAAFAGLYVAYGEAEPCRALAVERARRAELPTGVVEPWMRVETSQMSTGACVKGLFDSWGERLSPRVD